MTVNSMHAGDSTFNQLATLQLPSMPAGAPYLLKSLTDESIDFVELASVVEKFPGIAGKLISLVNSAWSAPASEVTSLEATCSRLGLGVVRSTSIALAVASPFNSTRCPSFDLEYYWCSVLLTADAASRLVAVSSSKHEFEPATARAAGLLHNLGLLWLADCQQRSTRPWRWLKPVRPSQCSRHLPRSSISIRRKPAGISEKAGLCQNRWFAR